MAQPEPDTPKATVELFSTAEDKDLMRQIRGTHTHEMVIGLCGPIGAPTEEVSARLQTILQSDHSYKTYVKKLSDFIEHHAESKIDKSSAYSRYSTLITEGNRLKSTFGQSVLAELSIAEISITRDTNRKATGNAEFQPERFCHVIDSIKNADELRAMKAVYGDLFICIGVYASHEAREDRLLQKPMTKDQINELIDRDSGEETKSGQSVKKTFHLSDFFIDCSSYDPAEIDRKLNRILDLVLGSKIITPSVGETSMYTAYTASLNSACLSRQVGAAVTDKTGYLLGVGWNDVPQFGGSVYNESSNPDNRCHAYGAMCYNDSEKRIIATLIAETLVSEKLLEKKNLPKAIDKIKDGRVGGLIEFSRAVHAEMLALLNAGRSGGERMQCGRIYVTTYPCHVCARHIIAAGIHEVHYIEPYRKSLAIKLHKDAITESGTEPGKVRLIPFEGVSPSRYANFFKIGSFERKNEADGKLTAVDPQAVNFKAETSLRSFPALESVVVKKLTKQNLLEA